MMPQSSIRSDNHIDGRSRFRKTFEGTCNGAPLDTVVKLANDTDLENGVGEEEYRECYVILRVIDVQ